MCDHLGDILKVVGSNDSPLNPISKSLVDFQAMEFCNLPNACIVDTKFAADFNWPLAVFQHCKHGSLVFVAELLTDFLRLQLRGPSSLRGFECCILAPSSRP